MAGSMLATLLVGVLAFSLVYAYLMAVRTRIGRVEDRAASTVMSRPTPRARVPRPATVPSTTAARSVEHA
jgi:4-hydroxybenzoate polyprenyltransferase